MVLVLKIADAGEVHANARIDAAGLGAAIEDCFLLSMDLRYSPAERSAFLARGQQLRVQFLELVGKIFDSGTDAVTTANAGIKTVNNRLKDAKTALDKAAAAIEALAGLAAQLDSLIRMIAGLD